MLSHNYFRMKDILTSNLRAMCMFLILLAVVHSLRAILLYFLYVRDKFGAILLYFLCFDRTSLPGESEKVIQ